MTFHARVDEIVGLFAAFVGQARAVRRLGSAAIDLCWVAAGRMDGFWETDLKPWDIAGGRTDRRGGRRPHHQHGWGAFPFARRSRRGHERTPARRDARDDQVVSRWPCS